MIYSKYATLLTDYCLAVKSNERVYITTTYLAEPLVQELLKCIYERGATAHVNIEIQDQTKIIYDAASEEVLKKENAIQKYIVENFDCYLVIKAPFNLRDTQTLDSSKRKAASEGNKIISKIYNERTGTYKMRRCLCQFPTQASAQEAGMSIKEYEHFIFQSCFLFEENPIEAWKQLGKNQQVATDYLNKCSQIQYKGPNIDIQFSTEGRTWINSDGKANMPSGEIYTAPVEDSVQGKVKFTLPSIYMGQEAEEVILEVKNGVVEKWEAKRGQELLDQVFDMPGARVFGEAAIGCNSNIQQITKNILFDEKIGGTIHMAVGQSYAQCGGKNESSVHWDMITDMKNGGEIWADGQLIYKDGQFII
ncbi:MAG: aminopeptidase [Bacteroidota bacterium]